MSTVSPCPCCVLYNLFCSVLFVFQVVTTRWRSVICLTEGTTWSENWAGDIFLQSGSAGTCSTTHNTHLVLKTLQWQMFWICTDSVTVLSHPLNLCLGRSVLWRWRWWRVLHITLRQLWMRSNCSDVWVSRTHRLYLQRDSFQQRFTES